MRLALLHMNKHFKNSTGTPKFLRNANNDWVEQAYVAGFEAALKECADIADSVGGLTTSLEEKAEHVDGWNRAAKAIETQIKYWITPYSEDIED